MQPADHDHPTQAAIEEFVPAEWDRLVRLCAHLSGDVAAADDLAQETLIEAWRHAGTLRDPSAHRAWLSGIARNVCLRWRRQLGRDIDRLDRLALRERLAPVTADHPELALEQDETAALLDRALGILPAATRDVIVLRYIEELGNREIAERLALSEGAVAVRLHRGKAALRQALARPELHAEAVDIGLVDPNLAGWRETRVWCPFCGRHWLEIRIDADTHAHFCRCAGRCFLDGTIIGGKWMLDRSRSLTSAKSILSRELLDLHDLYGRVLDEGVGPCDHCGRLVPVEHWSPDEPGLWDAQHPYGVRLTCRACGTESGAALWHLLIDTPDAQRFWRRHPRMEALPVREIEIDGRPALRSGFASVRGEEHLDIITARDGYEILRVEATAR